MNIISLIIILIHIFEPILSIVKIIRIFRIIDCFFIIRTIPFIIIRYIQFVIIRTHLFIISRHESTSIKSIISPFQNFISTPFQIINRRILRFPNDIIIPIPIKRTIAIFNQFVLIIIIIISPWHYSPLNIRRASYIHIFMIRFYTFPSISDIYRLRTWLNFFS